MTRSARGLQDMHTCTPGSAPRSGGTCADSPRAMCVRRSYMSLRGLWWSAYGLSLFKYPPLIGVRHAAHSVGPGLAPHSAHRCVPGRTGSSPQFVHIGARTSACEPRSPLGASVLRPVLPGSTGAKSYCSSAVRLPTRPARRRNSAYASFQTSARGRISRRRRDGGGGSSSATSSIRTEQDFGRRRRSYRLGSGAGVGMPGRENARRRGDAEPKLTFGARAEIELHPLAPNSALLERSRAERGTGPCGELDSDTRTRAERVESRRSGRSRRGDEVIFGILPPHEPMLSCRGIVIPGTRVTGEVFSS